VFYYKYLGCMERVLIFPIDFLYVNSSIKIKMGGFI
jgi:hypothetical protein